jgi:peptidoglycan/LPS O-acetylase OafA/YrhL
MIQKNKFSYDINCLRFLAVISVLIYHGGIDYKNYIILSSGWLGVDIFFVISGFIITKIIFERVLTKEITLKRFYLNRIRRIFPLYYFVILITLITGYVCLDPARLLDLSQSSFYSVVFFQEIFFYFQSLAYFSSDSLEVPLLHFWSLGIEEKFYILIPFIIIFFLKIFKKSMILGTFIFSLILIIISFHIFEIDKVFFFYFFIFRFFEFMFGVISYLIHKKYTIQNKYFSILSFLILIFLMSLKFDQDLNLLFIILTCIFSSLIIINKNNSLPIIITRNFFVLNIGLASFSIYLWHYPIFAFSRILEITNGFANQLIILLTLIIISLFTYIFVENYFRFKSSTKSMIIFISLCVFFILTIVFFSFKTDGLLNRDKKNFLNFELNHNRFYKMDGKICHNRNINFCRIENKKNNKYLVSLGDSHLDALTVSLIKKAKINEMNNLFMNYSENAFFLSTNKFDLIKSRVETTNQIHLNRYNKIKELKNSIILIGGRYPLYLENKYYPNEIGYNLDKTNKWGKKIITNKVLSKNNLINPDSNNNESLIKIFKDSINLLLADNHTVVLIYPTPEFGIKPSEKINKLKSIYYWKNQAIVDDFEMSIPMKDFINRSLSTYNLFDSLNSKNIIRVYPAELFCDLKDDKCHAFDKIEKKFFFHDDDHLSIYGAELLVNKIFNLINSK